MVGEAKERAAVLAGAILLSAIGRDRFYVLAQDRNGVFGRCASAFLQGHAGRLGANYSIMVREKDRDRMTEIAKAYYSDDSLHGFGDFNLPRPDAKKPIAEQRRAMVAPVVEAAIKDSGASSVIEIGTGNGDVIAYLARRNENVKFVGVDLSVTNAKKKHQQHNLDFISGYALDLLEQGLSADVVFATSTFCIFAPKELSAYLSAIKAKRLIISDPVTFGNRHSRKDARPISRHMDLYMWWHNYYGYLVDAGWTVDLLDTVEYYYPHNPRAKFVMVSASRR